MRSDFGNFWAALVLLLLAVLIGFGGRIGGLENRAYDYFQRYQYKSASDQILLVTVDSRAERQKEFWTGQKFGELAKALDDMGARMIVATQPVLLPDVPDEKQIQALEQLQKQAQRVASLDSQIDPLAGQLAEFRRRYDERLSLAKGFAEADPTGDVDGYDAAAMIQQIREMLENPATIFIA